MRNRRRIDRNCAVVLLCFHTNGWSDCSFAIARLLYGQLATAWLLSGLLSGVLLCCVWLPLGLGNASNSLKTPYRVLKLLIVLLFIFSKFSIF